MRFLVEVLSCTQPDHITQSIATATLDSVTTLGCPDDVAMVKVAQFIKLDVEAGQSTMNVGFPLPRHVFFIFSSESNPQVQLETIVFLRPDGRKASKVRVCNTEIQR